LNHPDRIAALAKYDRVVIELGTLNLYPEIVARLRQVNPWIHLDAYVVMQWWQSGIPFFRDFAKIVNDTNGVMVNDVGKFWAWSNVNLARTETAAQLSELILDNVEDFGDWNGIFIDILVTALHGQTDVGWRQMGYSSYEEFEHLWNKNSEDFVFRLLQGGRPVSTNYGNSFPGLSHGNMREAFPTQFGGTWESNMVGTERNPGQLNLKFADPRAGWICSGFKGYDPASPENQRIMRYHDASACLSGDYGSFGRYEWDEEWKAKRHLFWAPHYVHPQRGKGWLGEPTGAAYHVTMQKDKPVDLWVRKFAHGVAIVNPSSKAHSIYSEKPLRPIGGVAKTGRSVPAHDGLLLEAV
jgi:hypothetical protein